MQPIRFYAMLILSKWYVAVALAIVVFAIVVRLNADDMPEAYTVPAPMMPSPNALDFYLQAITMERDSAHVDAAFSTPAEPMPVAKPAVARADANADHVFTLAEKDRLVAENLPAIAELHAGMSYPFMELPARSFATVALYDEDDDRAVARLLGLEGQTRSAHGDWAGAMNAYLDCVKIGSDLPHGGALTAMLVGVGCERIGRKSAEGVIDHLSSGQARAAASRMEEISANEFPVWQTLRDEEWNLQASLQQLFTNSHWRAEFTEAWSGADADSNSSQTWTAGDVVLQAESPRTAFDNYTRYMNAGIAQSKLPWPAQRSAPPPVLPTDPINQLLLPVFSQGSSYAYSNLALDRLLETQLALHAYRLDHGRYPDSLAELVPKYLKAVPLDPFTDGEPLRYRISADYYIVYTAGNGHQAITHATEHRVTGNHYLLYSVGPDATDDGGTPMFDQQYPSIALSATGRPDEKGDIVAGVND
jgi:hypothetical protein